MKVFCFLILCFYLTPTALIGQKEDHQWIFNWWSRDDCSQFDYSEYCNASILDFNVDPPVFIRAEEATLDMDFTHAAICNEQGELILYSNGMSIHGSDHKPILNGDTISFGPLWANNTWLNEDDEVRTQGFLGIDCASFVPVPDHPELFHLIYYNFDHLFEDGTFDKLYATIDVTNGQPRVVSKDIILKEKIREPGHTSCAQHANGRDWWLLQFSNDTLFTYLIEPSGINLERVSTLPFSIRRGQTAVSFDDKAERYAAFQFVQSNVEDGAELLLFDFDRCTGELTNPLIESLPSFNQIGVHGIVFSASGQYLYINDHITCLQYDTWANDIFSTQDTVMTYDGSAFYEPTMNLLKPTYFGRMRKGPDNKIYISLVGQGYHLHTIHQPNMPAAFCKPEQNAIRMPTYTVGSLPTHNTLRLGPIDGSSCDTLGIDNNPVSRFRQVQDTLDHLAIDFVDLSYYEPNRWEWDFGDGNTSIERFPSHRYVSNDAYRVCLTVSNDNSADVSCDTLFLGVSSLDETSEPRNISLFPNPVEDVTRVAFHDYLPSAARITFYDTAGSLVLQDQLRALSNLVDLSGLQIGVYVYEVWDGEQRLISGKVIRI